MSNGSKWKVLVLDCWGRVNSGFQSTLVGLNYWQAVENEPLSALSDKLHGKEKTI